MGKNIIATDGRTQMTNVYRAEKDKGCRDVVDNKSGENLATKRSKYKESTKKYQ